MITYDVDGNNYPCHMFAPISVGADKSNYFKNIDFSDNHRIFDAECNECAISPICPTCYGFNYKYRGDVAKRDKSRCGMIREEIKASSIFQINHFLQKEKCLSKDEFLSLKAAIITYEKINKLLDKEEKKMQISEKQLNEAKKLIKEYENNYDNIDYLPTTAVSCSDGSCYGGCYGGCSGGCWKIYD